MASKAIDLTKDAPTTAVNAQRTGALPAQELISMAKKQHALEVAIDSAQPHRLKRMLKILCRRDRDAAKLVASELLVAEDDLATKTESRKRPADNETRPEKGSKRFKSRYAMCIQCEEEYDVQKNSGDVCRWHPGEREADYQSDVWADHDEDCHGRISDLEDERPEGFVWTCCDEQGDIEEGCETGPHASEP